MERKSKIKLILTIAAIVLIIVGVSVFYIWNKIKADTTNYAPVVTEGDLQTTQVTDNPEPDSRSEVAVPILMYHHIRNYNDPADKIGTNLSVPPENFKAQIDYLKNNGYATVTFQQFLDFPTKKLPDKPIILTFDDGYLDGYDAAFQNLKANGQVAVFYIITDFLGRPDQMTEAQVKEISETDMEIGSHTLNHPDSTKLSPDKLNDELTKSKSILEALTKKNVISFCYPSGQHNAEVDTAVKNAGYLTATTTSLAISSTSENKYTLSRLRIDPTDSLAYFADKIK